jgi:hypothetical protein
VVKAFNQLRGQVLTTDHPTVEVPVCACVCACVVQDLVAVVSLFRFLCHIRPWVREREREKEREKESRVCVCVRARTIVPLIMLHVNRMVFPCALSVSATDFTDVCFQI